MVCINCFPFVLYPFFSYFPKNWIANNFPHPPFHMVSVRGPSSSPESLLEEALQQRSSVRRGNFAPRPKLISFSDGKSVCLPPLPLSSSSFPSSLGLFLSIPLSGVGGNGLYISFIPLLDHQSSDSPPASPPLITSCPLNSSPPAAWSVLLAFFLSHFYFFFSLSTFFIYDSSVEEMGRYVLGTTSVREWTSGTARGMAVRHQEEPDRH